LVDQNTGEPVHAQLLRWIQLRFHEYWSEAEIVLGPVELPNFKLLYESIRYKQWVRPEIPAAYVQRKKPRVAELGSGTVGGTAKKTPSVPGTSTPVTETHSYQRNTEPNADLLLKGSTMGRILVFVKVVGEGVPKSDDGQEMCIAYHTKGGCYGDCARARGHGKLNTAEAARLTAYVDRGLEKMAAATTTSGSAP
jgi:hypothetical protein